MKKTGSFVYILLAFGILISGPRFSGAFAAALGIDLIATDNIFAQIEIGSGWALALFEAVAIAYVAHRFKHIQILDDDKDKPIFERVIPTNFMYWVIVLLGQVVILLTIPLISTVHLATQTFKTGTDIVRIPEILTISHIYSNFLTWSWLFLTSAASTLFVFLIGLVMDDFGLLNTKQDVNAHLFGVYTKLKERMSIVDPKALAHEANITMKQAADFLDDLTPIRESVSARDRLNALKDKSNNGV